MDHDAVTKIVAPNGYGVGVEPNPFAAQCKEWKRRKDHSHVRGMISRKIQMLFEPRFITPPETAECIESIVTMTDSRLILELGTCTGFTSLHILRAIVGKYGAKLTTIDPRPAHDAKWFAQPEIAEYFTHINGWTPDILSSLHGNTYDLVFVDSDHSIEHSEKELNALLPITRPGTLFLFHDCPQREKPGSTEDGTIFKWLHGKVGGVLRGTVLPTAEQLDCVDAWGPGYPKECNPHLGVFVRL